MATAEPPKTSRRKRRWGDGPTGNGGEDDINNGGDPSKRKSRFSTSPPTNGNGNGTAAAPAAPPPAATAAADPKARAAALQASIQARLAALKARTGGGGTGAVKPASVTAAATPPPRAPPSTSTTPTATTTTTTTSQKRPLTSAASGTTSNEITKSRKKAKVFELDMTTTAPTRLLEKQQREEQLKALAAKPKEKINPYLAHTVAAAETSTTSTTTTGGGSKSSLSKTTKLDKNSLPSTTSSTNSSSEEILLDTRLASSQKSRLKSRPLNFVAPGTYIALGEKKRAQAARAAESGYFSGRKVGNVVKSVGMGVGVGGEGAALVEAEGGGNKGAGYYGASEAGKVMEQTLPARMDAPELELEDYATIKGKKILTSISDVDVEKNDAAISAALGTATSSMPYAMEWWDAELLPGKLRKELAGEEGRAIASRAKKKVANLANKKDGDTNNKSTEGDGGGGGTADSATKQYQLKKEKHAALIEKCYKHATLTHSKTHSLLQHPVPILTLAQRAAKEAQKNKPPTLHLTKAERKRHRKLRRAERLREQQDLQAAGVIPPPEPRLTLSNYMKVLGDQAILDPSKMEAVVMSQIQSRKLKHEKMNSERKLTKEQKAAKHARKLAEDTSQSVKVALFYVKDMGHPYHRAKVDLNAQQNGITGGVLECEHLSGGGSGGGIGGEEGGGGGGMALVVAEGGEKAIKRYTRLMTVRMRWRGEDFYEEEEEEEEELMVGEDEEEEGDNNPEDGEDNGESKKKEKRKKFNPNNECHLIWTGMAVKRAFHSFMFQNAENSIVARKILEAKGVAHYWDLAVGFAESKRGVVGGYGGGGFGAEGGGEGELKFRLGGS